MQLLLSYHQEPGDGLRIAQSHDALNWNKAHEGVLFRPSVGSGLFRDPSIIRDSKGVFHMVWTTGWEDRGIGYARSTDLENWHDEKFIGVMTSYPEARNSWAPEIHYDQKSDSYLIFWSSSMSQHEDKARWDHAIYAVTTKDFESFSPTEILFDPDFSVIDAAILEEDGRYIMAVKNEEWGEKNIRLATSSHLKGPYTGVTGSISGKYAAEAPALFKLNGEYYLYFDRFTENGYSVRKSQDLEHWQEWTHNASFPEHMRHGRVLRLN